MIFDLKCNDTGVRCHQKEPKKIGFGLLGLKPVDRRASEVFWANFHFFYYPGRMISSINIQKWDFYSTEKLSPIGPLLGSLRPCLARALNVQTYFVQNIVHNSPK